MPVKIAVLDLYDGYPNQGMNGIQKILTRFANANSVDLTYQLFDVRGKNEVPDTSFDIYISSGGPGSPIDSEGTVWENKFFALIDALEAINNDPEQLDKKYGFFICHSFQLLCRKYKLGRVVKRNSTSFGIFPVHKTEAWDREEIFNGVDEETFSGVSEQGTGDAEGTFFAMDSRDWQVIAPDEERFRQTGAVLLAIEKERVHVNLERCMMAIRFSPYFFGTQFHPEADPVSMRKHLLQEKNKQQVISAHGEAKYNEVLQLLNDPDKLQQTRKEIIPSFLQYAIHTQLVT